MSAINAQLPMLKYQEASINIQPSIQSPKNIIQYYYYYQLSTINIAYYQYYQYYYY